MEIKKIILGALAVLIGVVLIPSVSWMLYEAKNNWNLTSWNGTAWVDDPAYRPDPNMNAVNPVLDLILYGFCFSLVGVGIGLMWTTMRDD
jgi:hypothetical protein